MAWFGGSAASGSNADDRQAPDQAGKPQDGLAAWWASMPSVPRGPMAAGAENLNLGIFQAGNRGAPVHKPGEVLAKSGQRSSLPPERDRVYRERVLVRVYHLNKTVITRALNRNIKSFGAYHTGVEVYGREWSFGMTFDDWSTGITWNPPGENPDHTFCETLSMGYTTLSPTQVWQLIEEMKTEWRGCTYHLLSRNCHHFSDVFVQKLGVNRIPAWLNELAGTGAATVEFLDTADSGYDNGEAVFDFFSGVRRSIGDALGMDPEPEPTRKPQPKAAPKQQLPPDRGEVRHDPFSALR